MEATGVTDARLSRLRIWNLALAVLHAAQAVLVLVLATDFAIGVTSQYPQGPPGTAPPAPEHLFDVPIGPAIAVFLALAAVDHLLTGTLLRGRYEADLRAGVNRFRWIEYSVSATLMIILIGFYTGLTGITEVILIVGANVAMILFGWLQEVMNPPGRARTTMLPFWFGCVAGAAGALQPHRATECQHAAGQFTGRIGVGDGAAERAAVADPDVAHPTRRMLQQRGVLADHRRGEDRPVPGQCRDHEDGDSVLHLDPRSALVADAVHVDQGCGQGQPEVEHRHQALATGDDLRLALPDAQQLDRLLPRVGALVLERGRFVLRARRRVEVEGCGHRCSPICWCAGMSPVSWRNTVSSACVTGSRVVTSSATSSAPTSSSATC